MPITRRKRANPPEQPENNIPSSAETVDNASATSDSASDNATSSSTGSPADTQWNSTLKETEQGSQSVSIPPVQQGENTPQPASALEAQSPEQLPVTQTTNAARAERHAVEKSTNSERAERQGTEKITNGERAERHVVEKTTNGERAERHVTEKPTSERQEIPIEGGRRTARGELFRRPPQVPAQPTQPAQPTHTPTAAPPLPPPSHEISLPLGNLLHLSYNPGYTGADEARSELLEQLTQESKKGGRARCWNCGSIAIKYDRWNTRSKTFGEVGVAICEICGVWSVM